MKNLIIALSVLVFSLEAFAVIPILTGEREAYTANTGFARRGNSSAGLYNPAGLAGVEKAKLSVSGTAFQNFEQSYSSEAFDTKMSSFQSVPTQVTSTWKIGSSIIAFSIFNTADYDYNLPITVRLDDSISFPMRLRISENRLMLGPSFARRISEKVEFGVSLLLEKRDQYMHNALQASFVDPSTGFPVRTSQFTENKANALSVIGIFGFNYLVNDALTAGLRIRPPSMQISGKIKSYNHSQGFVDSGGGWVEDTSDDDYDVEEDIKLKHAPEVGFGLNWAATSSLRVFVDLKHSFETKYQPYETSSVSYDGEEEELSSAFGTSVGIEYSLGKRIISAGALFSENPERAGSVDPKQYYGATIGLITVNELFESGIGAFYLAGDRKDETDNDSSKTRAIGLLLSTGYRF